MPVHAKVKPRRTNFPVSTTAPQSLCCGALPLPGAGKRRTAAFPLPPFESLPFYRPKQQDTLFQGVLLFWRRGWDSPRHLLAAGLPASAAALCRSPGRANAALRRLLPRPSNPSPFYRPTQTGHPFGVSRLRWRRGWDSNPRDVSAKLISSQPRYDHFDTSARGAVVSIQEITANCNALPERNPREVWHSPPPARRPTCARCAAGSGPSGRRPTRRSPPARRTRRTRARPAAG